MHNALDVCGQSPLVLGPGIVPFLVCLAVHLVLPAVAVTVSVKVHLQGIVLVELVNSAK